MPTSPNNRIKYQVLGVAVDALTMDRAAELIIQRANAPGATYVVKPYVEFFVRARRDPAVSQILNQAYLSLPDGVSVQWAVQYRYGDRRHWWRALGLAASIVLRPASVQKLVPEKFGGATFTWKLLESAATAGKSVYLIGSPHKSSIKITRDVIHQRLPNLEIAGSSPGQLAGKTGLALEQALVTEPVETELLADLHHTNPDIILVGMGFPLQEKLIAKLVPQLQHGILLGEGGSFDYDSFGGHHPRAPQWMRSSGLEWLWRLGLQPNRWRRQLAIPKFMWAVYRSRK